MWSYERAHTHAHTHTYTHTHTMDHGQWMTSIVRQAMALEQNREKGNEEGLMSLCTLQTLSYELVHITRVL